MSRRDVIDFVDAIGDVEDATVYAFCILESETGGDAQVEKKAECSPKSEMGSVYRAKQEVLCQIDRDNPQFSYHFRLFHSLRTKIQRLFSRMRERFKMRRVYKRGVDNTWGHVLKFINLRKMTKNASCVHGDEFVHHAMDSMS